MAKGFINSWLAAQGIGLHFQIREPPQQPVKEQKPPAASNTPAPNSKKQGQSGRVGRGSAAHRRKIILGR